MFWRARRSNEGTLYFKKERSFNSTQILCEILDWICYCSFEVEIESSTFASTGINTSTCSPVEYLTMGSSVRPTVTSSAQSTYAKHYIFCCTIHNLCTLSQLEFRNHHQDHGRDWIRILQMPTVRGGRAVAHSPYAGEPFSPMSWSHAL